MNGRPENGWWSRPRAHSERPALLNPLSLVGAAGGAALLAYAYLAEGGAVAGPGARARLATLAPFVAAWLVIVAVCLWRGLGYGLRASALLLSAYAVAAALFVRQGLSGSGRLWLATLPALVVALLGSRWVTAASLFSIVVYTALTLLVGLEWTPPDAPSPAGLRQWLGQGGDFLMVMTALILVLRYVERDRAETLEEAEAARKQLEIGKRRLADLTRQVRRQSAQLQAAAGVARAGASTLDLDALLDEAVEQMLKGFEWMGVHGVGCFLLDGSAEAAVLKAVASRMAPAPLREGDRWSLDQQSAVAASIVDGEVQVAAGADDRATPGETSAPEGYSEIALPLRSGGHTLGAMSLLIEGDARDVAPGGGDLDQIQAVVDAVAVIIHNAQLSNQTEAALEELETVRRRYSTEEWARFLAENADVRVDYTVPEVEAGDADLVERARRLAMEQGRPVAMDRPADSAAGSAQTEGALVVPLRLRGRVIGTVALHETRRKPAWTAEDVALAETVAEEMAHTVETLRLMDDSQRRLARERLVGEVTARMRETLDVESVLRSGAVGIREAMGLPAVTVRLADGHGDCGADGRGEETCVESGSETRRDRRLDEGV
ncbi:MAG: GAF domain-containing protein [Anaerolineae bacterium]